MKIGFGCFAPQGWRGDLAEVEVPHVARSLRDVTLLCEKKGFDSVWVYDHFIPYPTPSFQPCMECWVTLSHLSSITSRVMLGQLVTCNSYRSPSLLAKMAATLDVLSGGRLMFGVGAGWYDKEYEMYGFPFHKPSIRIGMLREALRVITGMWRSDRFTFEGKYYHIRDVICNPKPLQKPHPQIVVGGQGEQLTLKLAAEYADIANLGSLSLEEFAHKSEVLKGHCEKVGREYEQIQRSLRMDVVIEEKERIALEKAEGVRKVQRPDWNLERYLGQNIVGSPEECARRIGEYVDLGATYFQLYFPDMVKLKPIQLFSDSVLPKF